MPKKTVSNQRKSSDPFEIQTQCSFHQVRYLDKFLDHARTVQRQQLGVSLQDLSLRSMCILWREILSRGLNCRLLNVS